MTSKKFEKEFNTVLSSLAEVGYNNYWKVLNAKDYGVPQNRERIFIISIRKDIDTGTFTFPEKQELKLRVKDMLEPEVDEKFYINSDRAKKLIEKITASPDLAATDYKDPTKIVETRTMIEITEPVICASRGRNTDNPSDRTTGISTEQRLELKNDGISNTSTTVQKDNLIIEPKIKNIGSINGHQSGNVLHHDSDLSPCLCVAGHVEPLKIMQPVIVGSTQEHAAVKNDGICTCLTTAMGTGGGQIPMVIDTELATIKRLGNLYDENAGGARAGNVYAPNGLAPALQTAQGGNRQPLMYEDYRIRKLTPRECFRLMGFTDNDFDKIHGISNTQLYKMAGNSIVVNVLEAIFKQLFKETNKE